MAQATHWNVFTETPLTITAEGQYESLTEAKHRYTYLIGDHMMDDNAEPKVFRVIEYYDDKTHSVIAQWEFKGFRTPPVRKDPNRPMKCPLCREELNLYEDVEQWSDATIVYKVAGMDYFGHPEWEQVREDISEEETAHRVFCRHCGDAIPFNEWEEAFENR